MNAYEFIMSRTTQTPKDHCPHCGRMTDRQTSFEGETPSEGQLSICIGCAGVSVFSPELKLVMVPDKMLARTFSRETLAEIEVARQGIRQLQSIAKKLARIGKDRCQ